MMMKNAHNEAYWRTRVAQEKEWINHQLNNDEAYGRELQKYYDQALANITKTIQSEFLSLARRDKIDVSEAMKAVEQFDVRAYQEQAKKIVEEAHVLYKQKGIKLTYADFSADVNQRLRLYNATMRINRLEMIKSKIGLELAQASMNIDADLQHKLTDEYQNEINRQAGILGESIEIGTMKDVFDRIIGLNKGNEFSTRIWANQDTLKAKIDVALSRAMVQGQNPRKMAKQLVDQVSNEINNHKYVTERIARTEMARVQYLAALKSFKDTETDVVKLIAEAGACGTCKELVAMGKESDGIYDIDKAPTLPIHPNCRCSLSAWFDADRYEQMLRQAELNK